ncbi:MAG: Hpt domain-containing protein [Magnetococcales bacterium]|nr:Hpt domain-containing protein [Magnetococcales bacterium]
MNAHAEYQELTDQQKLIDMRQELEGGFQTVIRHYQAGILHRPEKIRQAVRDNDAERVSMESHSMKSVCRQVGLMNMGEMAARLETIGNAGDLSGAEELIERLIASSVTANHELTRFCTGMELPKPFFSRAAHDE